MPRLLSLRAARRSNPVPFSSKTRLPRFLAEPRNDRGRCQACCHCEPQGEAIQCRSRQRMDCRGSLRNLAMTAWMRCALDCRGSLRNLAMTSLTRSAHRTAAVPCGTSQCPEKRHKKSGPRQGIRFQSFQKFIGESLRALLHDLLEHRVHLADLHGRHGAVFAAEALLSLAGEFRLEIRESRMSHRRRSAVRTATVMTATAVVMIIAAPVSAGDRAFFRRSGLHRKADALLTRIHGEDADLDHVAHGEDVLRVLHIAVANLGDVHEAVLMDADIDERAEVRDVRDDAFHPAARDEIVDALDLVIEFRVAEFLARIARRLLEFREDIFEGVLPDGVGEEFVRGKGLDRGRIAHEFLDRDARLFRHLADEFIVFRVHRAVVERIFRVRNAEEARGLFERLGTEALDAQNVLAALERAVRVAVPDHAFRESLADARDVAQERGARAVHVHADLVHAAFDDFVEALLEFALVHVMLILSDADGLRLHLHEFRERILQTAADGNGAARGDVFLREFLDGDHARGIHGRAGFAHDDAGRAVSLEFVRNGGDERVRFAARGAVAYRDEIDVILFDQVADERRGFGGLLLRLVRENDAVVDELSVLVEDGDLAARAEARIEREHGLVTGRGREKHVLEVLAEHLERFFLRDILEGEADFAFHAGLEKAFPRVLAHFLEGGLPDGIALHDFAGEVADNLIVRHFHTEAENLLLCAAAEREHTVARDLRDGFGEIVVVLELGFLLLEFLADLRGHHAFLFHRGADVLAVGGLVGELFREDVAGAGDRGLRIREALLFRKVDAGDVLGRVRRGFLGDDDTGERLQSEFLRDGRTRALLRLVRSVKVFEEGLVLARLDLSLELRRELALFLDALQDGFLAFLHFLEVFAAVLDVAEFNFIKGAGLVLAVARDERNGSALVHKFERLGDAPFFEFEFFGDDLCKIHSVNFPESESPNLAKKSPAGKTDCVILKKRLFRRPKTHRGRGKQNFTFSAFTVIARVRKEPQ